MMYTNHVILLLVRHALTPVTGKKLTGRLPGFSLSNEGKQQAEALGERLSGAPLKAIYSSPLERCRETAAEIAGHHNMPVGNAAQVAEVDYGGWQGKSLKVLYRSKAWSELRARPADFRFPGGETIREAQTRSVSAIEGLRVKHLGEPVVVCSHADVIRLLVAAYIGLSIDLYNRISVAPASVTALVLNDHVPRLIRLADSGSLDGMFEKYSALKAPKPGSKAAKS